MREKGYYWVRDGVADTTMILEYDGDFWWEMGTNYTISKEWFDTGEMKILEGPIKLGSSG